MLEGVLYIAIGDRYLAAAAESARSLRREMPRIPIALGSDVRTAPEPFDELVPIEDDDGYRAKNRGMAASPFGRTVMLDVDTYVARPLQPVFQLLDRFDMALAHAPNRITLPLEDVPESFPEFNTGVIVFGKSPVTDSVFDEWLVEYEKLLPFDPPSKDQPSFRRVAYRRADLRIATLVPEYNQRFTMAGYFNQPVSVLHGWADQKTYESVAALMEEAVPTWNARAVFASGRVFNSEGEEVGGFR